MKKWSSGLTASKLKLQWRQRAYEDLQRLYEFLEPNSQSAALGAAGALLQAVTNLRIHPRPGSRLTNYRNREVRKISVAGYELRYELKEDRIIVLRFWHGRENR